MQELEELLEELFSEIGVQESGEENGDETMYINEGISQYYLYWKREKLMSSYKGEIFLGLQKFQNNLTKVKVTNNVLYALLEKIDTYKTIPKYQNEIGKKFLYMLEISIKYELEARDTEVYINETEAKIDLVSIYAEMGIDVTGLNTIGGGLGTVTTYWIGYITDDPYLSEEAKLHLNEDLLAVSSELSPSKKFKKLMNFGESISKISKIKWSKVPKPDTSNISNPEFKNIIEQLYRPNNNPVGNGSTADALRFEKASGKLLSPSGHAQKADERRTNLVNIYNSLNSNEKKIADSIYEDLSDAIQFNP